MKDFTDKNSYLEEEKPFFELSDLMWIAIIMLSFIFGLSFLVVPPLICLLVFLGMVLMVAILINPFFGIVTFLLAAYLKPTAYMPFLREFHPATIAAVGVAIIYGIHIMVYRDFVLVKSKQTCLMMFFAAFFIISSGFHYNAPGIGWEFLRFIQVVILYFLIVHMVKTKKEVYFLSFCLISIGVFTALTAFYNHFHGYGELVTGGVARAAITEGNPNYLALSLIMVIPIILGVMFRIKNFILKVIMSFVTFWCVIAAIFTFSRSGALGLLAVLALSAVKFTKKQGIFIAAFLLIFILGVSVTFTPPQYWDRVSTISKMKDLSIKGRIDVYRMAARVMLDHPFTGVGLSLHAFEMAYYEKASSDPQVTNLVMGWTHNMFLEVGAKMGPIAMLFFIWFIIQVFVDSRKAAAEFARSNRSMLATITNSIQIGLIGSIIMGMFAEVVYDKLFWIYCALTMVLSNMTKLKQD